MSKNTVYVNSDENVINTMKMMISFGYRHLPVQDRLSRQVIGVVSVRDLVRYIIENGNSR